MSPADSAQHPVEAAATPVQSASLPATRLGFWRRPGILRAAPMLSSFVFHAGILLVAIMLIRAIPQMTATEEPLLVASGTMVEPFDLLPPAPDGMERDLFSREIDPVEPDAELAPDWSNQNPEGFDDLKNLDPIADSPFITIGPGLQRHDNMTGRKPGQSRSTFVSTRSTKGIFVQNNGGKPARKIVYVCDASGSIGTSPARKLALVTELKKAIDQLEPYQHFNIAFFSFEDPIALSNGALLQATPENRQAACEFLDKVIMSGQTDPIPALKLAFKQNPELIYLLTDGEFTAVEPQSVVDAIRKLGATRKVMIHTIMLDNASEAEQKTLKEIASMTGGLFTATSAQEIIRSGQ